MSTKKNDVTKQDTGSQKVFTKTCDIGVDKNGNDYLFITAKGGKMVFINLVKDNKKHVLVIPRNAKKVVIEYTSYETDFEKSKITLFNVGNVSYEK